ncbi:MAG: riboflavin synthase [candidate division NC10 bacterium]|nr:riboflavin synthase [candidate division NC10 bacterium]
MFTGIIEGIGTVTAYMRQGAEGRVEIDGGPLAAGLRLGDSIAVDGACLTVSVLAGERFTADLSVETLQRTTLGRLRAGSRVNLERPLRLEDRLGGHLVTGHIDAVGRIAARTPEGAGERLRVRYPQALARLLAPKGSVAVDGISLTVAALTTTMMDFALIPYTIRQTTLAEKRPGAPVNLEADLVGKYVARLAGGSSQADRPEGVTMAKLREYGFA